MNIVANQSFLSFASIILLLSSIAIVGEARDPFNTLTPQNFAGGRVSNIFDIGLYLGAIKEAGPSRGEGHSIVEGQKLLNGLALGGLKDSGPSPGVGNKFTDERPSPGVGNKLIDSRTIGGIKDSGPSPGTGNKFTESGPSPGTGNKFTESGPSLGTGNKFTDSGPSPGTGNRFTNSGSSPGITLRDDKGNKFNFSQTIRFFFIL
ncbi:hypothetical protein ES332_A10G262000v1 [Gossypium tomentosum]|uniref:Uncharacterized protein n=1 Tax=Gossypium tomentosum TaxID=34277 RepID=A0A5D2NV34_GOSTO|nr:hypothetical protein ES332_A10G262000v1 [Gossypium tomentosum]